MMCLTDWKVGKQGNTSRVGIRRMRNPAMGNSVGKGATTKVTGACSGIRRRGSGGGAHTRVENGSQDMLGDTVVSSVPKRFQH